jgi:uncharacterized membrane protein YfcA|tara:strand:+ start:103837 stop:104580 length:744 start_codon:yes stop_codon:yes gene_type:complete
MEFWYFPLLTFVGIFAGWLNVMAGGGSLLTLPVMLFMGMSGPMANGTNRIAILAQNITAVTAFFRRGFSDFKLSITLALAATPGAVVGAIVGTQLSGDWFDRILALVMIAVMIVMALPKKETALTGKPSTKRLIAGHICMVGAGFWGGFIQIGVGFLLMPILHRVMGLDLVRVNMHKVFVVLCYTSVALYIFTSKVEILWIAGLCLAVGNSIGGWIGANMAISKGENLINRVLNIVLIVFIVKLLLF